MSKFDKYRKIFTTGNIYNEPYDLLRKSYPKKYREVWEEMYTIALFNTPPVVGSFAHSDIIIVYNRHTMLPDIVTERIYKRNYGWFQWMNMLRKLRRKSRMVVTELGFNYGITFTPLYVDCIHYKEEWWKWAKKHLAVS